jgi:hypothetical protein
MILWKSYLPLFHNILELLPPLLSDIFGIFQIEYAANDALVGVDIFMNLILAKMLNRKPDIDVEDIFSAVNEEEFWSLARSLIQGTVDTGFVGPLNSKNPAYRVPLPTTGDMELEEVWIFFADILPNRNRI